MKYFQEVSTKHEGREKDRVVVILEKDETHMIYTAMLEYNKNHPRNKKYKKLQKEMDNVVLY